MLTYSPPLTDLRFVLRDLLDWSGGIQALPGHEDLDWETAEAVIQEAGRLCAETLLPLNRSGDESGCVLKDGRVLMPEGTEEAYRLFREGGWIGLSCAPEHGGQGLPETLNAVLTEMVCATNVAFGITIGLTHSAYLALEAHGDAALKETYLPPLAEGRWTGTMCLTEPQCGTDLVLTRTRAEPLEDGRYRLNGNKIFISAGEHTLADNIVNMVLARLPDAPERTRGISLFLVPKRLDGKANGVVCTGIEHKMGLHGSPTCSIAFEDATGFLVGEPHRGLAHMFTMMNAARVMVGMQGLGLAETAWQSAAAYAAERRQGRAATGAREPDQPADLLLAHADVRAMVLRARALAEGMRALGLEAAVKSDIARKAPDEASRARAEDWLALMTPVIKAFFTDSGFEAANLAVQVHGGHGYIRETGVEQLVRDARIAQIYEGTNGIQALDLVGRKLNKSYGRLLRSWLHPTERLIAECRGDERLEDVAAACAKAFSRLQRASVWIAEHGIKNPEAATAAATPYVRLFALAALGAAWLAMARRALALLDAGAGDYDRAFLETKVALARFAAARILPETSGLLSALASGPGTVMDPVLESSWQAA